MSGFFRKWSLLLLVLALTSGVQLFSSWLTLPQIKGWYHTLHHPFWSPPDWVFGPVWTLLYLMMGLALYFVILTHENTRVYRGAYFAWGLQLFFNALWTPLFFHYHQIFYALFDITLLWIAILWTIVAFGRISKVAFALMIPYFVWVTYAWTLNLGYLFLN